MWGHIWKHIIPSTNDYISYNELYLKFYILNTMDSKPTIRFLSFIMELDTIWELPHGLVIICISEQC